MQAKPWEAHGQERLGSSFGARDAVLSELFLFEFILHYVSSQFKEMVFIGSLFAKLSRNDTNIKRKE